MKMRLFGSHGAWRLLLLSLPILGLLLPTAVAWGKVRGACVNCHTMHNSQDGSSVVDADPGIQPALTTNDCVGCHSNDSNTIKDLGSGSQVPIVYTTNAPSLEPGTATSMLAGGNFHWVVTDDTKGHNVFGLAGVDSILNKAPGGTVGAGSGSPCYDCHGSLATSNSGCRGCHLPAHHADDSAVVVDADHGSYRFLGDVMKLAVSGGPAYGERVGVAGIEDPDWEQTVSSSDHNGYTGATEVYEQGMGSPPQLESIGQMCAGCHGDFHDSMNTGQEGGGNDLSGAWLRHPSDVVIPDSGEYAAYTEYDPMAPVAKVALTADLANSPIVTPGSDVVTCISCHRPHGSPYPDMLRWDYGICIAGVADSDNECGCFVCHTAKD
jgi:hypothetical protein